MAALSNPLNSAEATLEYSINTGSSYTAFGTEVMDVSPDDQLSKIIERRLLGVARVQKFPARIDYGNLEITFEYSSSLWTLVSGWRDNETLIWIRHTAPDSGGTNGSRHVFKGYVSKIGPPKTPGDDQAMELKLTFAVDNYAFTAGV